MASNAYTEVSKCAWMVGYVKRLKGLKKIMS